MTTKTLTALENLAAVSTHTVEAYNAAGKTFVAAYRDGVKRAVLGTAGRYAGLRAQQTPSVLSDQVRDQMVSTQKEWSDLVIQRLDADTRNAMTLMDRVAVAATSSIDATVGYLQMIESPAVRGLVDGVISLHLPVSQLSAKLADRVVNGAQRVEARVNAPANDEVQGVEAQPARRGRKAA